jgi:nicotinamidase-related amidase
MDATVLLVMDVQRGIVERFGDDAGYLSRVSQAVTAARAAGVPVIHVTVGFRPGHPEVSARNRGFSAVASSGRFTDPEVHRVLTEKVFPRHADVLTVAEWAAQVAEPD